MRLLALLALVSIVIGCSKPAPEQVAVANAAEAKPAAKAEEAKPAANAAEAKPAAKADEAKPAAKADETRYGAGVTLPESVTITELQANVDKYEGKEVRVEGLVTGVCPKRGCWFDMAGDKPGQTMRFKVTDGVIVFPMEANGKYAVAQGTVRKMPMTLEQSKRWAAHQKNEYGADLDPDEITEPLTIVRLDGSGAMIRDAK